VPASVFHRKKLSSFLNMQMVAHISSHDIMIPSDL